MTGQTTFATAADARHRNRTAIAGIAMMVVLGGCWLFADAARADEQAKNADAKPKMSVSSLRGALNALDAIDGHEKRVAATCERMVDLGVDPNPMGDALDNRLSRNTLFSKGMEEALAQAESIANSVQAKLPAAQSCGSPAAAQPNGDIKGKIEAALARIAKPFDYSALTATRDTIAAKKKACSDHQNSEDTVKQAIQDDWNNMRAGNSELGSMSNIYNYFGPESLKEGLEQQIANTAKTDPEALTLLPWLQQTSKSLIANTLRELECVGRATAFDSACKALARSSDLARVQSAVDSANALEARRKAAEQKLTGLLNGLNATAANAPACPGKPGPCDEKKIKEVYNAAKVEYGEERFQAAKASLDSILATYGNCPGVPEKVKHDEGLIDRVINAKQKVATAVAGCDINKLETYIRQIGGLKNPHPKMAAWVALMRERIPRCKTKQIDNANADCRKSEASGGYHANIQADGSYYCVPDRVTADAACNDHHEGWAVRKVSDTGQIDCFPKTDAAQNKACQAKLGSAASAKGWENGELQCVRPKPHRTVERDRPRRRRSRTVYSDPNYDPAASQVIGIFVQGVINARGARRPPAMAQPRVHCHYNQFGQYHCGSN
jgi:hypothetical protein